MRNSDSWSNQPLVEPLSARELEILSHMAENRTNREIADLLAFSPNTVKWYASQIYGKLGVNSRRQAVSQAAERGLLEDSGPASLPQHNLPAQLTPFLGRQAEVARILEWMSEPTYRLLTVNGPGGMGKTRLAIQAASLLRETHRDDLGDGVFFVPFASLSGSASVVAAIAEAIGFSFYRGKESPEQKLKQYLRRKRMLLILDNFEHLIGPQSLWLLAEILAAAPRVRVMITSRARLNMRGEYLVSLGGMAIPEIDSIARQQPPVDRVARYSGIQLFVNSAGRVRQGFELRSDNLPAIARICALVQGMPLGIELAAAWMTVLEPDEIACRIEESLDFLQTDAIDVPIRQRSRRAISDSSWSLLTEDERLAVQRLAVFRGGFDGAGAEHAGGVPLSTLVALVNKCWVQRVAGGRYEIHELLRQYGAEKLGLDPGLEAAARDQHSHYYCDWLRRQEARIEGAEQQEAWAAIQTDIENIRAACVRATRREQTSLLESAVNVLGRFYYLGNRHHRQGEITFSLLKDALSPVTAAAQRTMVRVLAWQTTLSTLLGDVPTATYLVGESLALLSGPVLVAEDTRLERAHIALTSAYLDLYPDARKARAGFTKSLKLYQDIGCKWGVTDALLGLGRAARNLGDFDEARAALAQCLSLHQESGSQIAQSLAMSDLAFLEIRQAHFGEAEELIVQSLSLTPSTNRCGIAYGLGYLGLVQLLTGRFAKATVSICDCVSIWDDLGWRVNVVKNSITLARARMHAGDYAEAGIQAEEIGSLAREVDWGRGVGYAKLVLGEVALGEAAFAQAYRTLQESSLNLKAFTGQSWDVDQSAFLGLAARGLGRRTEAWKHLANAVAWAAWGQGFNELVATLSGIALLLADEGEAERAVELYALASRYPFVAESCWFEDVVGRQIAGVAAALPPRVATAARERGRCRDLERTVAQLSVDLGQNLSPPLHRRSEATS